MPTTRTRTQVTHTPEIEEALRIARRRWPGENPSVLLTHLVLEGARTIEALEPTLTASRRRHLDALIADFAGIYPEGYLDDLRTEWPE
ncbi:hypothetical protein CSIV_08925 [Microbacterium sp. CSI-V]|uniref:hypothetical protein n=1 Tax=unclassified Microbacterium TaxID=2609290 RepID=UPI00097C7C22|nr:MULTISPECIES: hypothetical protein [unclassified Microbacterium]MXS75738.1 hypothetical protein [Microbacterium sp. TL13]ONI64827.1 hypothetical protein CSIV_08925 [Microbacterium sp. CSI-V]